jgi:pimeloyl-ACP methyl ester carboxylesterase
VVKKIELQIDVTGAADAPPGPLELAATACLPDPADLPKSPVVMFAIPGGGYSRGYFDMHFAGHQDYSQAEHHVARGILFIALDPLGVGGSSIGDLTKISFASLASTYDRAVRQIMQRIAAGTLAAGWPALPKFTTIGIGQSMGGCVSILTQGRHAPFDAIAPLGYSAIHTQLPQRTESARQQAVAAHVYGDASLLDADTIAKSSAAIPDFKYPFHWEDVPTDILAADMAGGYPLRRQVPPFGSGTIPVCAVLMMAPGAVKVEAAAVKVPVLIGVGERDTCPDAHAEPAAYPASCDVAVYIVPRMAHMHNFAGTRRRLWERLVAWSTTVAHERMGDPRS